MAPVDFAPYRLWLQSLHADQYVVAYSPRGCFAGCALVSWPQSMTLCNTYVRFVVDSELLSRALETQSEGWREETQPEQDVSAALNGVKPGVDTLVLHAPGCGGHRMLRFPTQSPPLL
jgi:hypothetical protein